MNILKDLCIIKTKTDGSEHSRRMVPEIKENEIKSLILDVLDEEEYESISSIEITAEGGFFTLFYLSAVSFIFMRKNSKSIEDMKERILSFPS